MAISPVTRDSATAIFFAATRRGVLLLCRRRSTGEYLDPAMLAANPDDSDLEYAPAGGGARVVSWATLNGVTGDTGEPDRTVVGIVELDEGPWWWSQIVGVNPDDDLADLRVQVEFAASGSGVDHEVVPVFRPAPPGPRTGSDRATRNGR
jgi:uncharacterized OB-fold protein